MSAKDSSAPETARHAERQTIAALLYETSEEVLAALLENPQFGEDHLCLLLERKDLPGTLLEAIARRKDFLRSYRVKRALAFHPHSPRLVSLRLARDLYLMDLVQLSLLPAAPAELRRQAEELLLQRLPQLPLGQKLQLARRGSARVAGGLIAEGHLQVARVALDNAFLNEAQVLKVLSRARLPIPVLAAIAQHKKWSHLYSVRVALARHPHAPLECVLAFLPELNLRDLGELAEMTTLSATLRKAMLYEVARRSVSPD